MPRIAVFGGDGYLSSLIKNHNLIKKNNYIFFSRNKNSEYYINYTSIKKVSKKFKNFDFAIHLLGPNKYQLKKNKNLIRKKIKITSDICDLCLENNIKLIYVSSLQVYKNYGKKNIYNYSEINLKNLYSKSHYMSEKIIIDKFLKHKNMFTILRMGNVFGFKKKLKSKGYVNNLVHEMCVSGLKKKKITLRNASIQRTFIPSKIFFQTINLVIKKNFFKNSIINICYKNLNLKGIVEIIKKRIQFLFNYNIKNEINNFSKKKIYTVYANRNLKFNFDKKNFLF